jgi:Mg2+ and Co2+ transporter CorA
MKIVTIKISSDNNLRWRITGMDSIKTIEDLIRAKNLTPEELELHRELIDECRKNEQKINEYCKTARENLQRMYDTLNDVSQKATEIHSAFERLIEETETLSLRMIPDEKFHRE